MIPQRILGRSGVEVSALGLGTVKLGRSAGLRYAGDFELPDTGAAARLLDAARDHGITLLDTAPAYGSSEQRLGELLRGRRAHWVLCTKTGECFDGTRSHFDFSARHTTASVHRSLQRLGTDWLDIVLLHAPDDDLPVLRHPGALEALRALQRQGLVRAVGISVKSLGCALAAAECCDVVMLEYSLATRAMEPAIRRCAEHGCGVLVKKALGSGRLAAAGGTAAAITAALAPAGVDSVVVGTLDPAHLAECAIAAERAFAA